MYLNDIFECKVLMCFIVNTVTGSLVPVMNFGFIEGFVCMWNIIFILEKNPIHKLNRQVYNYFKIRISQR